MAGENGLAGRVIALTGAGGGLGVLIAATLLQRGALVAANHRSPSTGLLKLQEKHPDALHLVAGDIGCEETAEKLIAVARALGKLDVLILNAAITRDQPLVRMPVEDWDEVLRVNLRGAFLVTKQALRVMMRHRYGRLIYLSSLSALIGNAGQAGYAASKAALHGLSHTVAQEYASYNIRSVVLAPGLLDIGLGAGLDPAVKRRKAARSLLGIGNGDSVAATVAFLAGPDADFINGSVIRSDGGIAY